MFVHLVFFWLTPNTPADIREQMRQDAVGMLKDIPTVKHVFAGKPAMTPREVVDNTYDVGLCVVFDDSAGHDAYQPHPIHKSFGGKYSKYWSKVKVYDFQ